MQDKDFDRFFQQAFENMPEPEYNPADWDKLEDRLHDLNAVQPDAAAGASAGAGFGKLGFVASAVLVTAFNVAFFAKPELFKNAIQTVEKTAETVVEAETVAPAEIASEAVAAAEVRTETAQMETAQNNAVALSQTNALTLPETLPAVKQTESNNAVTANRNTPAKGTSQKAVNKKRTFANQQNTVVWPTLSTGNGNATFGNNGLSGGQPVATVQPCNPGFKPEIATVLVGQDTLKGSRFALNSCQMLEARLFTAGEPADKIRLTSNVEKVLPGATLVTEAGSNSVLLQWQPGPEMVRQQPYNFTIWMADESCAQATPKAFQFAVQVSPAFTAAFNGVTRINKGQETTLEIKGAPAGSYYQWVTGSKIVAENESGRLVAAPVASTNYKVVVTAPTGCVYIDSLRVEVASGENMTTAKAIPNIFTPNNDGLNDFFEIQLPEEGPYNLEVFDRDGKMVFSQEKYDNRWNAPKLASGTYYYIVTTPREGKTYKGWVEIMR